MGVPLDELTYYEAAEYRRLLEWIVERYEADCGNLDPNKIMPRIYRALEDN